MSERKRLHEERQSAEPKCLLRSRALRNPVVHAHLTEYRNGRCTLEEALARAVVALDEQNARLSQYVSLLPQEVVIVGRSS